MARLAEGFMQSILKQADPELQLEREVLVQHINTQAKLASVQLASAIQEISDKVEVLRKNDGSQVAITALEKLMHSMAS